MILNYVMIPILSDISLFHFRALPTNYPIIELPRLTIPIIEFRPTTFKIFDF